MRYKIPLIGSNLKLYGKTVLVSVLLVLVIVCLDPTIIAEPEQAKGGVTVACVMDNGSFKIGDNQNCLGKSEDWRLVRGLPASIPVVKVEPEQKLAGKIIAFVTGYSRTDSCHNPKIVGGKKLCLTAIGRDTKEGVTVACPRNLKLGTKVKINGTVYVCEDRYALRLDAKRGLPTFDIFSESHQVALNAGLKKTEVEILK